MDLTLRYKVCWAIGRTLHTMSTRFSYETATDLVSQLSLGSVVSSGGRTAWIELIE